MLAALASKTQITKMVGENIQLYIPTISETYIYRGLGLGCMAFFMFVVVAVNLSKVVRFYIKYYLYNSMYLVLGVVCIPFMLMSPGDPDNVRWVTESFWDILSRNSWTRLWKRPHKHDKAAAITANTLQSACIMLKVFRGASMQHTTNITLSTQRQEHK